MTTVVIRTGLTARVPGRDVTVRVGCLLKLGGRFPLFLPHTNVHTIHAETDHDTQDRQQWRQAIQKGKSHIEENISQKTNMVTISALAFLMLLPLSSSVSTAGEALNRKLDYSRTNEQSTSRKKPYIDVIIGHDGQQRERYVCTYVRMCVCA